MIVVSVFSLIINPTDREPRTRHLGRAVKCFYVFQIERMFFFCVICFIFHLQGTPHPTPGDGGENFVFVSLKFVCFYFLQIERNMIVVTVFFLIVNRTEREPRTRHLPTPVLLDCFYIFQIERNMIVVTVFFLIWHFSTRSFPIFVNFFGKQNFNSKYLAVTESFWRKI